MSYRSVSEETSIKRVDIALTQSKRSCAPVSTPIDSSPSRTSSWKSGLRTRSRPAASFPFQSWMMNCTSIRASTSRLKSGIGVAASGFFIFTLLHGLRFFNYLLFGTFKWIFQWGLLFFLLKTIGFAMILYFLVVSYQTSEALTKSLSGEQNNAWLAADNP